MKQINVLLCCILDGNLGDAVIADCTKYLLQKIFAELQQDVNIDIYAFMQEKLIDIKRYQIIVFSGGGIIKYKYQQFYQGIATITHEAEKRNIPVFFNAVGVEGYDENDTKCQTLKQALNRPCVKFISTRDDLDTLKQYITKPTIALCKVVDPAVYATNVYQIHKKKSDVIGVGVIREGIFDSNGIEISRESIFRFWKSIIEELEQRGKTWKIFTNGWSSDMKFALNLMRYMGRENQTEVSISKEPGSAINLVQTISEFSGVIAARLHANIISYSLDIPSVGIVWNDKLKFWGDAIGYPQRFFEVPQFNAVHIIDQLEIAMEQGYTLTDHKNFKESVYLALHCAIQSIL